MTQSPKWKHNFSFAGACPLKLQEEYVKAGEMATLYCGDVQCDQGDKVTLWKKDTSQETYLHSNMSAEEQQEMGVLVFGNCLIILNASVDHQGNYSCDSNGYGPNMTELMQ